MTTINIYAGQRVLYKDNFNWRVGILLDSTTALKTKGLFLTVQDLTDSTEHFVEINNIYLNAVELTWEKDEPETLIPIEDFIEDVEDNLFTNSDGIGYVSDGEYKYYPITFKKNWLEKQPFKYIVWYNQ